MDHRGARRDVRQRRRCPIRRRCGEPAIPRRRSPGRARSTTGRTSASPERTKRSRTTATRRRTSSSMRCSTRSGRRAWPRCWPPSTTTHPRTSGRRWGRRVRSTGSASSTCSNRSAARTGHRRCSAGSSCRTSRSPSSLLAWKRAQCAELVEARAPGRCHRRSAAKHGGVEFAEATDLMVVAAAVLDERDDFLSAAAGVGVELPGAFEARFEATEPTALEDLGDDIRELTGTLVHVRATEAAASAAARRSSCSASRPEDFYVELSSAQGDHGQRRVQRSDLSGQVRSALAVAETVGRQRALAAADEGPEPAGRRGAGRRRRPPARRPRHGRLAPPAPAARIVRRRRPRSIRRAARRPSTAMSRRASGLGSSSMKMHSPGQASAAWMADWTWRRARGRGTGAAGVVERGPGLLDVGDAVLELGEDVGTVVDAQPVAGAEVLVDPDPHGGASTVAAWPYTAALDGRPHRRRPSDRADQAPHVDARPGRPRTRGRGSPTVKTRTRSPTWRPRTPTPRRGSPTTKTSSRRSSLRSARGCRRPTLSVPGATGRGGTSPGRSKGCRTRLLPGESMDSPPDTSCSTATPRPRATISSTSTPWRSRPITACSRGPATSTGRAVPLRVRDLGTGADLPRRAHRHVVVGRSRLVERRPVAVLCPPRRPDAPHDLAPPPRDPRRRMTSSCSPRPTSASTWSRPRAARVDRLTAASKTSGEGLADPGRRPRRA